MSELFQKNADKLRDEAYEAMQRGTELSKSENPDEAALAPEFIEAGKRLLAEAYLQEREGM